MHVMGKANKFLNDFLYQFGRQKRGKSTEDGEVEHLLQKFSQAYGLTTRDVGKLAEEVIKLEPGGTLKSLLEALTKIDGKLPPLLELVRIRLQQKIVTRKLEDILNGNPELQILESISPQPVSALQTAAQFVADYEHSGATKIDPHLATNHLLESYGIPRFQRIFLEEPNVRLTERFLKVHGSIHVKPELQEQHLKDGLELYAAVEKQGAVKDFWIKRALLLKQLTEQHPEEAKVYLEDLEGAPDSAAKGIYWWCKSQTDSANIRNLRTARKYLQGAKNQVVLETLGDVHTALSVTPGRSHTKRTMDILQALGCYSRGEHPGKVAQGLFNVAQAAKKDRSLVQKLLRRMRLFSVPKELQYVFNSRSYNVTNVDAVIDSLLADSQQNALHARSEIEDAGTGLCLEALIADCNLERGFLIHSGSKVFFNETEYAESLKPFARAAQGYERIQAKLPKIGGANIRKFGPETEDMPSHRQKPVVLAGEIGLKLGKSYLGLALRLPPEKALDAYLQSLAAYKRGMEEACNDQESWALSMIDAAKVCDYLGTMVKQGKLSPIKIKGLDEQHFGQERESETGVAIDFYREGVGYLLTLHQMGRRTPENLSMLGTYAFSIAELQYRQMLEVKRLVTREIRLFFEARMTRDRKRVLEHRHKVGRLLYKAFSNAEEAEFGDPIGWLTTEGESTELSRQATKILFKCYKQYSGLEEQYDRQQDLDAIFLRLKEDTGSGLVHQLETRIKEQLNLARVFYDHSLETDSSFTISQYFKALMATQFQDPILNLGSQEGDPIEAWVAIIQSDLQHIGVESEEGYATRSCVLQINDKHRVVKRKIVLKTQNCGGRHGFERGKQRPIILEKVVLECLRDFGELQDQERAQQSLGISSEEDSGAEPEKFINIPKSVFLLRREDCKGRGIHEQDYHVMERKGKDLFAKLREVSRDVAIAERKPHAGTISEEFVVAKDKTTVLYEQAAVQLARVDWSLEQVLANNMLKRYAAANGLDLEENIQSFTSKKDYDTRLKNLFSDPRPNKKTIRPFELGRCNLPRGNSLGGKKVRVHHGEMYKHSHLHKAFVKIVTPKLAEMEQGVYSDFNPRNLTIQDSPYLAEVKVEAGIDFENIKIMTYLNNISILLYHSAPGDLNLSRGQRKKIFDTWLVEREELYKGETNVTSAQAYKDIVYTGAYRIFTLFMNERRKLLTDRYWRRQGKKEHLLGSTEKQMLKDRLHYYVGLLQDHLGDALQDGSGFAQVTEADREELRELYDIVQGMGVRRVI